MKKNSEITRRVIVGREYKPIICLDFDGVIHSYVSGWKGPRNIPDPPVNGAIEFIINTLIEDKYKVAIYSSRSRYLGGRRAMKKWLHYNFSVNSLPDYGSAKKPFKDWIGRTAFADPYDFEVDFAGKALIKSIQWPLMKPPAYLQIDDRAITFNGEFPTSGEIDEFKPWYKED